MKKYLQPSSIVVDIETACIMQTSGNKDSYEVPTSGDGNTPYSPGDDASASYRTSIWGD